MTFSGFNLKCDKRAYVKRFLLRFVIHAAVKPESYVNEGRYLQLSERA